MGRDGDGRGGWGVEWGWKGWVGSWKGEVGRWKGWVGSRMGVEGMGGE